MWGTQFPRVLGPDGVSWGQATFLCVSQKRQLFMLAFLQRGRDLCMKTLLEGLGGERCGLWELWAREILASSYLVELCVQSPVAPQLCSCIPDSFCLFQTHTPSPIMPFSMLRQEEWALKISFQLSSWRRGNEVAFSDFLEGRRIFIQ